MAAGALAGPGDRDTAAAVLAGVDKTSAGLVGVEKDSVSSKGAGIKYVSASLAGVSPTGLDKAVESDQVSLCFRKDVCVFRLVV